MNHDIFQKKLLKMQAWELGKSSCPRFADGEFEPCYEETIRGSFTFIIQSTFAPADTSAGTFADD